MFVPERLVSMANQISHFFAGYPQPASVDGVANHIRRYWSPQMRADIFAHIDAEGGKDLDALALEALKRLRSKK